METIIVLGLGISGTAASLLLLEKGYRVYIADSNPENKNITELIAKGAQKIDYEITTILELKPILVVRSPGIKITDSLITSLIQHTIPIISEVELALMFIDKEAKIIAITGSNGKTTTTMLLHDIIKNHNSNCFLAGNIGTPLSAIISDITANSIVILELSSFQLENTYNLKPNFSAIINLTPNHLDATFSLESYYCSKLNILTNVTTDNIFILNCDDIEIVKRTKEYDVKKITISQIYNDSDFFGDYKGVKFKGQYLLFWSEVKLLGFHNRYNILIALAIAINLKIAEKIIIQTIKEFTPIKYRLEEVASYNEGKIINDSKSTTVQATLMAIRAFDNYKVRVIVGGRAKAGSFALIGDSNYIKIYAYGESRQKIQTELKRVGLYENLEQAFNAAIKEMECGDIVLFSPGCSSFDQYKHYIERGEKFNDLVFKLLERSG